MVLPKCGKFPGYVKLSHACLILILLVVQGDALHPPLKCPVYICTSGIECEHLKSFRFFSGEIMDATEIATSKCNSFYLQSMRGVHHSYPFLRRLTVINSGLISVGIDTFHQFPAMQYLNLSDNKIMILDSDSFKSVTHLKTLVLTGNRLQLPLEKPFLNAPQLLHLDISRCNLTLIPTTTFSGMPGLVSVNMSFNSIHLFFGNEFSKLENLTELILDHSRLKIIDKNTFRNNLQLKKLSLNGNYFLTLDCAGFEFLDIPSLEVVWMDDCEMYTLPSYSFEKLKNLTNLSANNNYLKNINFGDIRHLNSLKQLSVVSSQLQCGCVEEFKDICCSWDDLEVITQCDWEAAKIATCNPSFWTYLKPWQWQAAMAIIVGCVIMLIISIFLLKGPCLRRQLNINSSFESIYM